MGHHVCESGAIVSSLSYRPNSSSATFMPKLAGEQSLFSFLFPLPYPFFSLLPSLSGVRIISFVHAIGLTNKL